MNTVSRTARLRHAIALTAATAVVSTALIAAAPVARAADAKKLSLLNFNDFHGRIMAPVLPPNGNSAGTVNFAGVIEQQRKAIADAGGSSLLLSGGDNIGASLFASSMAKDQPTIDVLNALDLDASAVGNHEFDQGYSDLVNRVIDGGANAEWPYLGANVRKSDGSAALDEYAVKDVDGIKVGVIGVVTQETPTLVSPGGVAGLKFTDPVEAVNRVADQLTDGDTANGEADVIVAEYHEGAAAGTTSTLAAQVAASPVFKHIVNDTSKKVDVIFNAHTHQRYAWVNEADGVRRSVTQAESYGAYVTRVDLTYDVDSDAVTLVDDPQNIAVTTTTPVSELTADFPRVKDVNDIVTAALAKADEVGSQKVADVTADITTAGTGGTWTGGVYTWPSPPKRDDRASESTLGGLVADSLVSALSSSDRGGATIGVVNPGGLRAELYKGNDGVITYAEANSVLPFVNNLWTTTLTGAQFKTMLEQQWQRDEKGNVPTRAYLQLGLSKNVGYTFDATRPEGDRITSISIDGASYDPAAKYRIGTFSFLAQGGDNFRVFTQGSNTKDSGLVDRDAWIDYLKAKSPLTPSFARHSVAAPALGSVKGGTEVTFTLGSLDLTSSGSPANTTVNVKLGTVSLGDFPVTAGSATVKVTIPAGTVPGDHQLVATASPSKTSVRLPVTVTGADFAAAPVPRIIGTVKVGSTVGVSAGAWSPRPVFDYAWLLDGRAIPGATDDSLVVTPAMGGHKLQVTVIGASTGYTTTERTSAAATVVKLKFTKTAKPVIHGTAKVGRKLTVSVGKWSPKPAFTYRWLANGKTIKGATKSSLKLTKAQAGKRITVKVTGTKLGYDSTARTSSATKKVRR